MEIRIKSCQDQYSWYAKHIGKICLVTGQSNEIYHVKIDDKGVGGVLKEDAEEVKEIETHPALKEIIQEQFDNFSKKYKPTVHIENAYERIGTWCNKCNSIICTCNKARKFESGAIRDNDDNKENYIESLSWLALKRFAFYMKSCEDKFGVGNWKKGIPIEEYEKSLMRHIQKYFSNKYENTAIELEVDHLAAAMFNLQGIIHEEERQKEADNNSKL